MEFRIDNSWRTVVFSFLLMVQLSRITASQMLVQSKICGSDQVIYSSNFGHAFFYINGKMVDRDLICKAVKQYQASGCLTAEDDTSLFCDFDRPFDEMPPVLGRKSLHTLNRLESTFDNSAGSNQNNEDDSRKHGFTPKHLAIAIPGLFVLCCSLLCPCFYARRKQTAHTVLSKDISSVDSVSSTEMNHVPEMIPGSPLRVPPSPSRFSNSPQLRRIGSIHLNMSQVIRATNNFSSAMIIGEGGFGTVYKAQLQDGQVVAIKRAKKELFQTLSSEFSSEVELLSKIDHRSLVKLLGYLDRGNERLIITEYVPNGTLREHLDGMHGKILDFNQRLEIAIDVAHALTYLHLYSEKQIIHRDVKSSNILLTEKLRAKVADFGFARLGAMDSDKTHVSTKVKGTVGYLDPEYMRTFQLTPKSDVYSFGILLLEILTGRRPVELKKPADERVTLRWVSLSSFTSGVTCFYCRYVTPELYKHVVHYVEGRGANEPSRAELRHAQARLFRGREPVLLPRNSRTALERLLD